MEVVEVECYVGNSRGETVWLTIIKSNFSEMKKWQITNNSGCIPHPFIFVKPYLEERVLCQNFGSSVAAVP